MEKREEIWICPKCNSNIGQNSILCDSCLLWYHTKCEVKLKSKDKDCDWFCSIIFSDSLGHILSNKSLTFKPKLRGV
ncbi:PHD-type domain-containing protein [Aphis craccivora]|uniref:PHD-type domain-containing protein n=1 Tax=Aphis craccivora TaxID=307492 RepID=A0A6G0Y031_APHCR|nr:PHD-type domain-containing protein [Aphis craccivora]